MQSVEHKICVFYAGANEVDAAIPSDSRVSGDEIAVVVEKTVD